MIALARITRLPGAVILLPMLAGASLSALAGTRGAFGPVTDALTRCALPCIAVLLIAVGAQVRPAGIPALAGRAGVVLFGTTLVPALLLLAVAWRFGREGVVGIPLLTLLAVALSSSYAMWAHTAHRYGTREDAAAGCLASAISSSPVAPLLVVAVWQGTGGAVSWRLLVDSVLPLIVGVALGAVLPGSREPLRGLLGPLLPALAFSLGWGIPIAALVHQAPAGLALAAIIGLISGGLVALAWHKVLRRSAVVGWSAAAVAANSAALPQILAAGDPAWRPYLSTATAQAATAALISTALAALLVTAAARRANPPDLADPADGPQAVPSVPDDGQTSDPGLNHAVAVLTIQNRTGGMS